MKPRLKSPSRPVERPSKVPVSLGKDGFFRVHGRRELIVGANYWPSSCGVEMWQAWPEAEIKADLRLAKKHSLKTLRFFLRWQDFEPEAGRYDERQFERLADLLGHFKALGLLAQPSLFVGWMSGGVFWPTWKAGRNLYEDPLMIQRAEAFVRKVAAVCAPYADSLLGFDLGNELNCLEDSSQASPAAVKEWCGRICAILKAAIPGTLVVSGTDHNLVCGERGWRMGAQPGTDYYSIHHYPVPQWHPLPFDGMQDPLAISLAVANLKVARAFGPVMLQEFGSILCGDPALQRDYLVRLLPACQQAGANGFLWWCLKDIQAKGHPYDKVAMEASLGLFDSKGKLKPGSAAFIQFAQKARPVAQRPAPLRIYFPEHYYSKDAPQNPGNQPSELSARITVAGHVLTRSGRKYSVQAGIRGLDQTCKTLLITGALLNVPEVEALEAWVRRGGHLLWHGPDPLSFGPALTRLLGARALDFRKPNPSHFEIFGQRWKMASFQRGMKLKVGLNAELLASDDQGLAQVWRHKLGKGKVVVALPIVEDEVRAALSEGGGMDYGVWYENILGLVGR